MVKNMDPTKYPNKKPRLDDYAHLSTLPVMVNEDLWGQDDITAEEFDMIEIQATQSHLQNNIDCSTPFTNDLPNRNLYSDENSKLLEEMKQKQYELEGKIKLLTQTLEETKKTLKDEKLNRENIITSKIEKFQKNEIALQKELEKLQTILCFKEQEIKTVVDKVYTLENQIKEKPSISTMSAISRSPNKFYKRFDFQPKKTCATEKSAQTDIGSNFCRKFKLHLKNSCGENLGNDAILSLFCDKFISPDCNQIFSFLNTSYSEEMTFKNSYELSFISVANLSQNKESEQLWQYYEFILREHIMFLKNLCKNSVSIKNTKCRSSPLSLRHKEINIKKMNIISALKDLTTLLSFHHPPFNSSMYNEQQKVGNLLEKLSFEPEQNSSPLFEPEQRIDPTDRSIPLLLESLLILINPITYPKTYTKEEFEWSLRALISWSLFTPEWYGKYDLYLPFVNILTWDQSITSLSLSLKLLISLVSLNEFTESLEHKNDFCIICAVGSLCLHKIAPSPLKYIKLILLVEHFLLTLFSHLLKNEGKLDLNNCFSELLQGFITILWKCTSLNDEHLNKSLILKKGLYLLNLLSTYVSNFKERRLPVEEDYILLINKFLLLAIEDPEFKEFTDIIHELWDFQEYTNEFDELLDDNYGSNDMRD